MGGTRRHEGPVIRILYTRKDSIFNNNNKKSGFQVQELPVSAVLTTLVPSRTIMLLPPTWETRPKVFWREGTSFSEDGNYG